MTRTELHEFIDIVMDARERGRFIAISFHLSEKKNLVDIWAYHKSVPPLELDIWSDDYPTFSDFTQAVKEYIHGLG